nr:reverse transcriptase domain-containing protein [Tanacetum cinerariifolium]
MVKKHDGSVCVDFTDLNKACPRDYYPLPAIDWKVESLYGYPFKCFLDAYKGYHQIQLAETDEEKTGFHTGQGVYCYTKMPFGLKNAGATYQRLMDKAFESQMGQNIEVYVDDLVVKSHTEVEMVRYIKETFQTLRKINMKLNLKKCSFELAEGVFLGYVITPKGIKPCPEKTTAVLQLPSPLTIKEVQSLNGKLASLNRTSVLAVETTFIRSSPIGRTQTTGRANHGPELNYSPMEKLVLSLVFAEKRLRRYFQAHPITVITDQPIKQVMSRPDVAGRLHKWSIMLGEHNITYRPRTSIKGQIPADFLNEIPDNASQGVPVAVTQEELWTLFTDGSSCVDGSGAGLILTNPEGVEFTYALRFQFAASNNEVEYEALVSGLRIATQIGVKNVQANVDSKLVANQVLGTYVAKEDNMIKYLEIVKGLVSGFTTFSISQVPQSKNKKTDALSKIASTSFAHLSKQVLVEVLETKSITRKEVTAVIEEEGLTWMTKLVNYLKEGILPGDEKEAQKLYLKARPFLEGQGKVKFLIVVMDYFTKWIEAKVVATITGGQVKKFVWDNIVCRFGIPGEIISDNGKQFADNPFKDWCDKLNITQRFAYVKHPQSNGLVERANRSLREEIGMPTYRTTTVDVVNNDEELRLNLDLLEERRELAVMSEAKSKSNMMKYYNSRVRGVAFKPGDFVYRSNDASHAVAGGKLGPK